jgi:hypothetical protein
MTDRKHPAPRAVPVVHRCPVCGVQQTKIARKLANGGYGSTSYVCARVNECAVGINLTNVDTWARF